MLLWGFCYVFTFHLIQCLGLYVLDRFNLFRLFAPNMFSVCYFHAVLYLEFLCRCACVHLFCMWLVSASRVSCFKQFSLFVVVVVYCRDHFFFVRSHSAWFDDSFPLLSVYEWCLGHGNTIYFTQYFVGVHRVNVQRRQNRRHSCYVICILLNHSVEWFRWIFDDANKRCRCPYSRKIFSWLSWIWFCLLGLFHHFQCLF